MRSMVEGLGAGLERPHHHSLRGRSASPSPAATGRISFPPGPDRGPRGERRAGDEQE
jgi:hypothetical protein